MTERGATTINLLYIVDESVVKLPSEALHALFVTEMWSVDFRFLS